MPDQGYSINVSTIIALTCSSVLATVSKLQPKEVLGKAVDTPETAWVSGSTVLYSTALLISISRHRNLEWKDAIQ
jgi:hypothetical protein